MKFYTKREIEQKVKRELDLEADDFISPEEMTAYTQEAVDMAEGAIMNLNEDFYLTRGDWTPITDEIEMPEDMYATKIRRFEIRKGDEIYKIDKNYHLRDRTNSYAVCYNLYNKSGGVPIAEIQGIHECDEYRIHYIRNAGKPALDNDKIDVPECAVHFVSAYIKAKCYEKEIHPNTAQAKTEVEYYKKTMQDTLSAMVDDGSDFIEADYRHYNEFESGDYYF
jgi:hypothetical protein